MIPKKFFTGILIAGIALMSCSKTTSATGPVTRLSAKSVLYWNETAYKAFGGDAYQHSMMAARINAMVHLAIHDALNGIEMKYSRYAFSGTDSKADPVTALSVAAYTVLLNEIPGRKSFLDSALAHSLKDVMDLKGKERGIVLGKAAAQALLNTRVNDGAEGELFVPIPPFSQPGVYLAVPPFNIFFAPHWEHVKLFSLERKDQFRSAPHPALGSTVYQADYQEVKNYGRAGSMVRTQDQTDYAKFWYEFSEAGWNRVVRRAVEIKDLNLLDAARLFALVDMAISDAYVAGWDSKVHYNFWRPYSAIRHADVDGNPLTDMDGNWEPELPTPPVPDYPSTHSALGKAAAAVLARVLGDNTAFSFSSPTAFPAGATRSFQSFSQAADENASSRVMAGIHFRFSCDAGKELGEKVGNWTVERHLRPLE